MSKRPEVQALLGKIKYQLWPYPSTWSTCSRPDCNEPSRGGNICVDCLVDELGGLIPKALADQYTESLRGTFILERTVLKHAENKE